MERDAIVREIMQATYHPKNTYFQRNSSLIKSLHYYHDNIYKSSTEKKLPSEVVNQIKDVTIEEVIHNRSQSPSNLSSSMNFASSSFVREQGNKYQTKTNFQKRSDRADPRSPSFGIESSNSSSYRLTKQNLKLPSLSVDRHQEGRR
jgi:hypothetical protein